jgi:hypothetical protein
MYNQVVKYLNQIPRDEDEDEDKPVTNLSALQDASAIQERRPHLADGDDDAS